MVNLAKKSTEQSPPRPPRPPRAAASSGPRTLVAGVTLLVCGLLVGISTFAAARVWASLLVVLCAAAGATVWWRAGGGGGRRKEATEALAAALAPLLGYGQTLPPSALVTHKWTRGPEGAPQFIWLQYDPAVDWQNPTFRPRLLAAVQRILGVNYGIPQHDPRACRLLLSPAVETHVEENSWVERATMTARSLLGESASVEDKELTEEGELRSITIRHQAVAKVSSAYFRRRVQTTMAAALPGRWRAQWDLVEDRVVLEQIPTLPTSVWIPEREAPDPEHLMENYKQLRIPLGVDADGNEIHWQPAVVPQMLVSGGTGRGKTSFVTGVVAWITRAGFPVWISDAKRVEFLAMRDWPGVQVVAGTVDTQVALIHRAWQLQEHRYHLMETKGLRAEDFEPLFVVLDEHAEFVSELIPWYQDIKVKGDPAKAPILEKVASLARKARLARIHLIVSLQRPDVALMGGGEFRDNFGMRVSLGRLTPQGALMMWNDASVGVALPAQTIGRAMITGPEGMPVESQTYRVPSFTSDPDSEEGILLEHLRPAESRHERLLIIPPEPEMDLDDDKATEPVPPHYSEFVEARWVKAADYPELDPLNAPTLEPGEGGIAARDLASPMALLGLLNGQAGAVAGRRNAARHASAGSAPTEEPSPSAESSAGFDGLEDMYGVPEVMAPGDLQVGDLVQIEQDVWATVSEEPISDPDAPESVIVPLRIEDEDDVVSIDAEDGILVRRARSEVDEEDL